MGSTTSGSSPSRGQASVVLVAALAAILDGALVLGIVARGVAREAGAQRAADLAAFAGARAMSPGAMLNGPARSFTSPDPRQWVDHSAQRALALAPPPQVAELVLVALDPDRRRRA